MRHPEFVVVGLTLAGMLSLSGCRRAATEASSVRDSAGIELVEHPAGVIAAAPVWTIDTAQALWSLGGGDDADQDLDNISCATWVDDGLWVCHQNPHEMRRYDKDGRLVARFGRKGEGPGEFRSFGFLGIRGDTLDFWDGILTRATSYRTNGILIGTVAYNTIGRSKTSGVRGRLRDGRLMAMDYAWAGGGGDLDGKRGEMPVYLLAADGTAADSLQGHPGFRQYRGVVYEGGQSFSSGTTYHLDGPSVVAVDPDGFTVALPDTAEVIRRGPDGAVQRIIRLGMPRRPLTEAEREAYITRDSVEFARQSPQFVTDMVKNYREGRFVDRLAPFERAIQGPDGELWLERTWLSADSLKQYVILDRHGMISGTLSLPMRRTLWWIGTDAVLASWRDADDVRHLSLHPLHRDPHAPSP